MTHMLAWLAAHYAAAGKFFLLTSVTLFITIVGTALPQLGLAARWPRQLAMWIGVILTFLGGGLAIAKAFRPDVLKQLPWAAVAVTFAVGVVFAGTAWFLTSRYGRTTQQRLRPMADAAWRTISRLKGESRIDSYLKLQSPNGKAVVDEILAGVRKKQARPILLASESGTGKTCTLMSIAAQCRSAFVERHRRPIIAVYIDVAQLAMQSPRVPLRDYILSQVAQDTGFVRELNKAWEDKRANVSWLFLFDNADRALMRWGSGEEADAWSTELIDFLSTNPARFRAVVTGHDLSSFIGQRIELSPLSQKTQAKFLSSRGVTAAQQSALLHEKSFRQYIGNLGWLDLVSDYLAQAPGNTPNNFLDLMNNVVTRQIAFITSARSELSDYLIVKVAQETAERIEKFPISYRINRAALLQFLGDNGYMELSSVELVIDELVRYGMMTKYFIGDDEVIEFTHDSVRSYYIIGAILNDNAIINIDEVLSDPSNTTIVISLLQLGSDELKLKVIRTAEEYLTRQEPTPKTSAIIINRMLSSMKIEPRSGVVEEGDLSPWTTGTYNWLHILDAGLNWRPSEIPENLRETTDMLLAEASPRATPVIQKQMLDVLALANSDVAAACCAAGLRSSSGSLAEAAARKVMLRRELFDLLGVRDKMRFVISVAFTGVDSWTSQHIDSEYSQRLRFAASVGKTLGVLLFVVIGIPDIVDIAAHPSNSGGSVLTLAVTAATIAVVAVIRKDQGVTESILAACIKVTFIILIVMAVLGGLAAITAVVEIVTGHLSSILNLLEAYVFLWPICSLYYLAVESVPAFSIFVFPFKNIATPLWSLLREHYPTFVPPLTRRRLAQASLGVVAVAAIFVLTKVSEKGWRFGATTPAQFRHIHAIATWTAWSIALACIAIIPIADYLGDLSWIRLWKRAPFESSSNDVMVWLYSLHTRRGTERMLTILTRRQPTSSAIQILSSLHELREVLEWVNEVSPTGRSRMHQDILETIPLYLKPDTKRWIRQYDRRYPGRLNSIANSHGTAVNDYAVALDQLAH